MFLCKGIAFSTLYLINFVAASDFSPSVITQIYIKNSSHIATEVSPSHRWTLEFVECECLFSKCNECFM